MTKYQNAVMWLGLALVFIRFLTTGQRSLFHNLIGGGGNTLPNTITPQQFAQNLQAAGAAAKAAGNKLPKGPAQPQRLGVRRVGNFPFQPLSSNSNTNQLGPPQVTVL